MSKKYMYHSGMRPGFPVVEIIEGQRTYYYEQITGKKWTLREINSGCGRLVEVKLGIPNLQYCSHCNEWFQFKQFEKE